MLFSSITVFVYVSANRNGSVLSRSERGEKYRLAFGESAFFTHGESRSMSCS